MQEVAGAVPAGSTMSDSEIRVIAADHVRIDYTNWKGERAVRVIRPRYVKFEANEWHKEEQWILFAEDVGTGRFKGFAMKDIHSWEPLPEGYSLGM